MHDDRELNIELAKLQIEHQHITSFFTVLISVVISLTATLFATYITLGYSLREMIWIYSGLTIFAGGTIVSYIAQRTYIEQVNRLEKEIEELKKKYLW